MKTIFNSISILFALMLSISDTSFSQERTITGKVRTFNILPVNLAEIMVLSSNEVVLTNTAGEFTIKCMPKDKIKVTARGFKTKKVKLKKNISKLSVDLVLLPDEDSKEIAVGYGHVLDKNKLDAVSSKHEQKNNFSDYSDMYTLIRTQFPNVKVDGNAVIIRGTNSLHMSSSALIVVDGVITNNGILQSMLPPDVKRISILKNGSMYGSRGANGAVIIETKYGDN